MTRKPTVIVPLATALAALAANSGDAQAATPQQPNASPEAEAPTRATNQKANLLFTAGEELMGLIVSKAADGTLMAAHGSHSSHASHSSHTSSHH
jgi:hypothetical protein